MSKGAKAGASVRVTYTEACHIGAYLKIRAQDAQQAAEHYRREGQHEVCGILLRNAAIMDDFADRLYKAFRPEDAAALIEEVNELIETKP